MCLKHNIISFKFPLKFISNDFAKLSVITTQRLQKFVVKNIWDLCRLYPWYWIIMNLIWWYSVEPERRNILTHFSASLTLLLPLDIIWLKGNILSFCIWVSLRSFSFVLINILKGKSTFIVAQRTELIISSTKKKESRAERVFHSTWKNMVTFLIIRKPMRTFKSKNNVKKHYSHIWCVNVPSLTFYSMKEI